MLVSPGFQATGSFIVPMHPDEVIPTSPDASGLTQSMVARRVQEDKEIRAHLMQLDTLRQECERLGKYRKAQQCLDRIREVNLRYAKKIEIEARRVNTGWKRRMMEDQQLELLNFHDMWERKMKDYDSKAETLRYGIERQHAMDMQSHKEMSRLEVMERRLRPSKTLVALRDELRNLVQQRMYMDAERVKREITRQEAAELLEFEVNLEKKMQGRLRAAEERLHAEREAVEQRLAMNREELLTHRQRDFHTLVKRHNAALHAQEQATALVVSKAKDCINRQVKAYIKDPVKTGLELVHLSEVALGGKDADWGANGRQGTSFLPSSR